MHKLTVIAIVVLGLVSPFVQAGVVMDMVTKNASGQETERTNIYAQSDKIRMDGGGGDGSRVSMIFLGNEFLVLDHKDKSYFVIDEAMLDEVTSQINAAMKQMEEQMAGMPPEQRAMMEQMMKGRMQGMMGQKVAAPPPPRVEAAGTGKWHSGTCRQFSVYEGDEKIQDICAAALNEIEGSDEVMRAFRSMAAYMKKMMESMPMGSGDGVNPGELMDQIDGFPVRTIDYEYGEVARELTLESVIEQDIDEMLFAAPDDYRRQDAFGGR